MRRVVLMFALLWRPDRISGIRSLVHSATEHDFLKVIEVIARHAAIAIVSMDAAFMP